MKLCKKTILNFTVLSLVLTGSFASCKKNQISNISGAWVSNPEPNVTITLYVNSKFGIVNTSPQNLDSLNPRMVYLFHNGDLYIIRGDTLYFGATNSTDPNWSHTDPDPNATPTNNYGFIRTMLSPNSMKLQSFGLAFPALGGVTYVTDYLFERKTN
jgi:hypothetical protein